MKMIRTAALATASAAALLTLAACGNNETKVEKAPADAMPAEPMTPAVTEPMVGGVAMNPADNIVANATDAITDNGFANIADIIINARNQQPEINAGNRCSKLVPEIGAT